MDRFLEALDKYKYGLLAAMVSYVGVFIYTQMPVIEYYGYSEPPPMPADMVIPEDEEQLKLENIQIDFSANSQVKNAVRDQNDKRKQSDQNWSSQQAMSNVDRSVEELEKQFFEEAGGSKERAEIQKKIDKLKQEQKEKEQNKTKAPPGTQTSGNENAPIGDVMVSFSLSNRRPHLNKMYYVRNPGYTCGQGSGVVTIRIKVNNAGDVISAVYDPTLSSNATPCMIEQGEKYAGMSRFMYAADAPKSQDGTITYKYVSQ